MGISQAWREGGPGKEMGSVSPLPQLGLGSPAEAELAGAGGTRIF